MSMNLIKDRNLITLTNEHIRKNLSDALSIFAQSLERLNESYTQMASGENCVYHYTSSDGLLNILRNKSDRRNGDNNHRVALWFTRYDCLNDRHEQKDIYETFQKYCQVRRNEISPSFFEIIDKIEPSFDVWIDDEGESSMSECDAYICCFSREDDLLPMWNYYSKSSAYSGYSIGFNIHKLKEQKINESGFAFEIYKVLYNDNEKYDLFDRQLMPLIKKYTADCSEENKGQIVFAINAMLSHYQYALKNQAFEHEKEVRSVLYLPKTFKGVPNIVSDIQYRNSNGYVVPYVEYYLDVQCVKTVRIAPLLEENLAKKNVKEYLDRNDYKEVDVRVSSVPIRF